LFGFSKPEGTLLNSFTKGRHNNFKHPVTTAEADKRMFCKEQVHGVGMFQVRTI
jgi:hypothetical protein